MTAPLSMVWVWALVGLFAVGAVLGTVEYYLLQRTAESVVLTARTELISHLLRLPMSEYRSRHVGDLVSRVASDTTLLRAALTDGLVEPLGGILVLVGSLIAMMLLDPVLAVVTILVVAIVVAASLQITRRLRALTFETQSRLGDLTGDLNQTLSAISVVRATGATDRAQARLGNRVRSAFDAGIRAARSGAALQPLRQITGHASLLVVLGVGGYRVTTGHLTVAELVTFLLFMSLFMGPVNTAFTAVQSVAAALGALQRITDISRSPPRTPPTPSGTGNSRHRRKHRCCGSMVFGSGTVRTSWSSTRSASPSSAAPGPRSSGCPVPANPPFSPWSSGSTRSMTDASTLPGQASPTSRGPCCSGRHANPRAQGRRVQRCSAHARIRHCHTVSLPEAAARPSSRRRKSSTAEG